MVDRSDTWDGGYKHTTAKGKKVFVIYRRVRGRLYEVSTRCTSSQAAEEQFRRWQADPENYNPRGEVPREALRLEGELGGDFLRWSRDTKRNSTVHLRDQKRALVWWEARIAGVDLRKLTTARVAAELEGSNARKSKIATLKTFYAWLREERHLVTTAEDPTFGQIKVPQAKPRQLVQVKAVDRKEFERTLKKLKGWTRDALEVLGGTGWHVSELQRFAADGVIGKHPQNGSPVLLCPHTKGGVPLRTQVNARVQRAAKRLRERGEVDYFRLRDALRAAGAKFNPGYLRHSVATWAVNAGADPASVAAFLGHRSPATTKKFYATFSVPLKIPTMGD